MRPPRNPVFRPPALVCPCALAKMTKSPLSMSGHCRSRILAKQLPIAALPYLTLSSRAAVSQMLPASPLATRSDPMPPPWHRVLHSPRNDSPSSPAHRSRVRGLRDCPARDPRLHENILQPLSHHFRADTAIRD